jgi:hypothetical protein
MKRSALSIFAGLLVTCAVAFGDRPVYAQTVVSRPAFRAKLIEAVQDVDAMNDPVNFPLEEAMNRVHARRSIQELGRVAQSPMETNIAAHAAQYLQSVRTCIFARSTSTPESSRDCLDGADKERSVALRLAGIEGKSVYPHATSQ